MYARTRGSPRTLPREADYDIMDLRGQHFRFPEKGRLGGRTDTAADKAVCGPGVSGTLIFGGKRDEIRSIGSGRHQDGVRRWQ